MGGGIRVLPREEVDKKDELKLREEETVIQSFSNVRVQIENQSASTNANAIGTLTLTSERVVFQRREGRGDGEDGGEGDNAAETINIIISKYTNFTFIFYVR